MIAIINYGVGNLFSLSCSFDAIGVETVITNDKEVIDKAEKIILPGVGAFEDAAKKLHESKMDILVKEQAKKGKPILGICLGMHLLFDIDFEYGEHKGLGLIKGEVKPISDVIPKGYKIPHIGWNRLEFKQKENPHLKYINEGDFVYFVHSYYAANCEENTVAATDYGAPLTAIVANKNIYGCQFHPEKSGETGLKILKAFCETE